MQDIKYKLTLCDGPSCIHSQSKQFRKAIEAELEKQGIADSTEIHLSGCLGMCKKGPILIVNPGYVMYGNLKIEDMSEIVQKHLIDGRPVARLTIEEDHLYNRFFRVFGDVDFFGKQMRITLRNCGIIDPENIDDYLSVLGFEAIARVLTELKPNVVFAEVKKAGIRG
ncbi:MAG: (2Fe-2S) ferredoxin domain-containing protein, partial [Planctomycetota bacterium]